MKVARIHESPNGRYHVTNDSLPYLDERGINYPSRRNAIIAIRNIGDYTHYLAPSGTKIKL